MSQSLKQLWKNSASLIILGKNPSAAKVCNANANYKVSPNDCRIESVRQIEFKLLIDYFFIRCIGISAGTTIEIIVSGSRCIPWRCHRACRPCRRMASIVSKVRRRRQQIEFDLKKLPKTFVYFPTRRWSISYKQVCVNSTVTNSTPNFSANRFYLFTEIFHYVWRPYVKHSKSSAYWFANEKNNWRIHG